MKKSMFRWPDIASERSDESLPSLWNRLLWMAGIWASSIALLLVVAMVLRWVPKN